MATRPRRTKQAKENSAASLIEALKFISAAQHASADNGQMFRTHCVLKNNQVIAFDGILTIGHPIEEEISACPHTATLLTALQNCGQTMTITQLDSGRLSIKSDKFKALVPCETSGYLPTLSATADAAIPGVAINDNLKKSFEVCGAAVEHEEMKARVFDCSILVNPGFAAGTNGFVLIEHWHGIDLPPDMVLPGRCAAAVAACSKPLIGFGYSGHSVTFHFEGGAFIKSQLYVEKWPYYQKMFKENPNAWPLPPNFFEAVKTLEPFVDKDLPYIYLCKNLMQTAAKAEDGATFEIEGLPQMKAFNIKFLNMIKGLATKIDFGNSTDDFAAFFGEGLRGMIAPVRV